MSAEKVLFHCSNPRCERWKQFFEPLTLDGLSPVTYACTNWSLTDLGQILGLEGRVKVSE